MGRISTYTRLILKIRRMNQEDRSQAGAEEINSSCCNRSKSSRSLAGMRFMYICEYVTYTTGFLTVAELGYPSLRTAGLTKKLVASSQTL
jgi:hypothetical protein